jgi:hypothetical protein
MEDFVEKCPTVGQNLLKADESPRLVGRRIVIRLELGAKVEHHLSFSTESWKSRLRFHALWCPQGTSTAVNTLILQSNVVPYGRYL